MKLIIIINKFKAAWYLTLSGINFNNLECKIINNNKVSLIIKNNSKNKSQINKIKIKAINNWVIVINL